MKFLAGTFTLICLLITTVSHADFLLVGNKSGHDLWALDLASGEKQAEFKTRVGPHEVEVSPDGRFAVVSNYGEGNKRGNSLTVIDWHAGQVSRVIDLGRDRSPHGMAFLPDGRLVVTTEGSDRLLVVDVESGAVLQRIGLGRGLAHMVAVDPDGNFAWVTNLHSGRLEKVDLQAGEITGSTRSGAGAEGVAVARSGSEVWVTNRAEDTVSVIDAESLEIVATLQSKGFPIRVVITPDGRRALVTNARAATVTVFDVEQRELIATVEIAEPGIEYRDTMLGRAALPIGAVVHPDGTRAFVAVSGADQVAVIDTETWQVTERWATGREPDALGILSGG